MDPAPEHDRMCAQVNCQVIRGHDEHGKIENVSRTYEIVEKSREEANWGRNWSASFYLDVKTSSFTRQDEFYAYDI